MLKANLSAYASVNHPPYEWSPIAGSQDTWRNVTYVPEMNSWGSNARPAVQIFDQGDHIAIHMIDKVANLLNAHPDWITEVKMDGSAGTRPNGIMLSYMIPKKQIIEHGLPDRSELEAAFKEDAHSLLTKAYAEQKWFPIDQTRDFASRTRSHDPEWQQIEEDIRRGVFRNFSKQEKETPTLPAEGFAEKIAKTFKNKNLMIASGVTVVLGATPMAATAYCMEPRTNLQITLCPGINKTATVLLLVAEKIAV